MREADESVELFGASPGRRLSRRRTRSSRRATAPAREAVHPGFGFLAENAAFAEALRGGRHHVHRPAARRDPRDGRQDRVEAARGRGRGVDRARVRGRRRRRRRRRSRRPTAIGYPVLLKASAGGGGKGMRIARDADGCREAFERASGEALASFGDGRVFVERFIERPRHIEIQVLGDEHGNVVHLGERECSIQRRYQKVIEEAPSPFVDEDTRAAMGAQAVALARAVGYVVRGHGRDDRRRAAQLLLPRDEHAASGRAPGHRAGDRASTSWPSSSGSPPASRCASPGRRAADGHAIECRVYAEDADAGFVPATGRLDLVRFPAGEGIRVDHGVVEGQEVSASFDPMIAKVVAYGQSRDEAMRRGRVALRNTVLLGTVTNTAFLERVLAHPDVRRRQHPHRLSGGARGRRWRSRRGPGRGALPDRGGRPRKPALRPAGGGAGAARVHGRVAALRCRLRSR